MGYEDTSGRNVSTPYGPRTTGKTVGITGTEGRTYEARYDIDSEVIAYGASPRATIYLTMAAKAYAFIQNRGYVIPEDVKSIGMDVLRHRIIVTYEAEAEDMTSEDIVKNIFDQIEVP